MSNKILLTGLAAVGVTILGGYAAVGIDETEDIQRIDFGVTRTATEPVFLAELQPASDARIKEFRIPITHETIEIAPGVEYEGWTFGGTVPGPTIRVREGDRVRILLVNESPMGLGVPSVLYMNAFARNRRIQ